MRFLRGDEAGSTPPKAKLRARGSDLSRPSTSSASVAKRKVDELFRRLQPHTLVQSTEKMLATLRIAPKLFVNGEELLPRTPPAPTVAVAATTGSKQPTATTTAWRFSPKVGRFHYGLSLQYASMDTELTLESLKDVRVILASSAMNTPRCLPLVGGDTVSTRNWRLVAETDRRVGLALYELALGDWQASSLVALVWTHKHEVARFFLQLHTTELLYSAPPRSLDIRRDDDLDPKHGLHSCTAAISLRSLDELFWECEVYGVEFPTPEPGKRRVTVKLLNNVNGCYIPARDRVFNSERDPEFRLETEVVKCAMDNCFIMDFTLWDADCIPVWGFTRLLELKVASYQQQDEDDTNIDLSVSTLGGTVRRQQIRFRDERCDNEVVVKLSKFVSSDPQQQSAKKTKTCVAQVDLTLGLQFVNSTFGTKYEVEMEGISNLETS
ncbi:hypothetical protein PHMEG_00019136 [Phytophthora megakarya]|uniref:Uncharacterized protein n=1 Tax=Phytophthora megakarya TaxID=4795 RepID=A0A225VTT7_9STRA|nr:hypothetical protein PHMEG_00019136 [Phytophthora megakarya]